MSSMGGSEEVVHSAVPIPDLTLLDRALKSDEPTLRKTLEKFRPADVGKDLSRRPIDESHRILRAFDKRHAAAMLLGAHPAIAAKLLSSCDARLAAETLSFLPTDHRVGILALMDPENSAVIEQSLDPEERKTIRRMLAYPDGVAARLMTPKTWTCQVHQTAKQAMEILKQQKEQIEVAQNCYVLSGKKLVGVIALRDVATASPETRIEEIMTRDPLVVNEETSRSDAAEIIKTHQFLSLPVVDSEGNLTGALRLDDLFDAALNRTGAAILNQGGVIGKIATQIPYFQTSIHRVVRSRLMWLILLFVAETATGTVLRHFESELAKVVALSFFVPLLIGTGGNAGSQTVSTIIRALAIGEVRVRDIVRVIGKEFLTGLLLGSLLGAIAFGRALLWGVSSDLAICVAITILTVCTWANTVGAAIPILAQKAHIDPTVVSAPLITTLVDASGLFIYFTVAHLTIAQLH